MKKCDNQAFKDGRIAGGEGDRRQVPKGFNLAQKSEWMRGYEVGYAAYRKSGRMTVDA